MLDISINNLISLNSYNKLNNYYNKLKQCENSVVYFNNIKNTFSKTYKNCKELFKSNESLLSLDIEQEVYTLSLSFGVDIGYGKYNMQFKNLLYKFYNTNTEYLNDIKSANPNFIIIRLCIYERISVFKEEIGFIKKYITKFKYPTKYKFIINTNNIYCKLNDKATILNTKLLSNILSKIQNVSLKKTFIELLYEICDIKNVYLAKDIKEMLLNNQIILPKINIIDIKHFHNKNELFNNLYKECVELNYNKYDINFSYIYNKLYKFIKDTQLEKFKNDLNLYFKYNNSSVKLLSLHYNWIYNVLFYFLSEMYIKKDSSNYNILENILNDYVIMCRSNHSKIDINRIGKNLKKLHDEEIDKLNNKKINILKRNNQKFIFNNKYNKLIKNLTNKYILIDDELKLYKEGLLQHNCVYTYKNKIINNKSIIYHLDNYNKSYTIEIGYYRKKYIILQFFDKYNKEADITDVNNLKNELNYINSLKGR